MGKKNLVLGFILVIGFSASAQTDADSEDVWPRKFSDGGKEFTIYQPQVESWQGNQLEERCAVSVQTPSAPEPVFGVIWLKSRTDVDKAERMVALQDINISKTNFPTEPGMETTYRQTLQKNANSVLGTISLDRLRASMSISASEAKHKVDGLKNDPPEVMYSDKPAVLVLVDGPGVLRETGTPNLLRVVNSRALIVFNKTDGIYNLNIGEHWYQAASVNGPWKRGEPQGSILENLNMIKHENSKDIEAFDKAPDDANVFSSTSPAELIQTKGSPQFEPIKDTELLYVTNTPDNIFMNTKDQTYFVTLSGRWFKSKSLKGPWKFVEADKLPTDFAKIPETHPKGEILASVAGTPDAKEAAIASEIPQTAAVDRQSAQLSVTYDGNPQFAPINNSPLQYASNTPTPVIRVSDNAYYAVENGVWFTATSPQGPWVVASEVPQVIYSIPPSAPVYYVTYVYVYGASPRYVYVGYLPGYLGSYVSPSGVVVYGTGYYYTPWVHHYWYGYPATYGFGFAWGFGFGWAFRPLFFGAPVYHPWWGPWPHYWAHAGWGPGRVFTVNHANIYHGWDHSVIHQSPLRNAPLRNSPQMRGHDGAPRGNNVYADHNGNVYRHEPQKGWQQLNSHQWNAVNRNTAPARAGGFSHQELDREKFARERGAARTVQYRSATAPHTTGFAKRRK